MSDDEGRDHRDELEVSDGEGGSRRRSGEFNQQKGTGEDEGFSHPR